MMMKTMGNLLLVLETKKPATTKGGCFEMHYLPQQFESTESSRGRKSCKSSGRERESALPAIVAGKPAAQTCQRVLPLQRGCSFQGSGSRP